MIDHDNKFFIKNGPFSLKHLAQKSNCQIVQGNADVLIYDIATLENLSFGKIACLHNTKYRNYLTEVQSGACIVDESNVKIAPKGVCILLAKNPYRSFAKIIAEFYHTHRPEPFISSLSAIDPQAKIGNNCIIEPFVSINANAIIGDNVWIKSHTAIGNNVVVGNDSTIENNVTITHAVIGKNAYIKSGARIGQQGFGFHMDQHGHVDVPQVGRVIIGDNVQIGSNTTIDRGSQSDTIIGSGCRIDNLVQIAHNVKIGNNSVLVAQVGIAGSTTLGNFVIAAGQVGITGHLSIGDNVQIAAQSGVMRDIPSGSVVAGSPSVSVGDWRRQVIALQRLIKAKL